MISLRRVTKSYGNAAVLKDVNLEVGPGDSTCVVGPSGRGKTTLIKIIALLVMPDSGEYYLNGLDVSTLNYSQRLILLRTIGYSFQEPLLLPYLNCAENVSEILSGGVGRDYSLRGLDILRQFGLENKSKSFPRQLSGGQRKRVDLARAIAKRPKILLADEPFTSLDSDTAAKVANVIREEVNGGMTVIYTAVRQEDRRLGSKVLDLTLA